VGAPVRGKNMTLTSTNPAQVVSGQITLSR